MNLSGDNFKAKVFLLFLLLTGCTDPYTPPTTITNVSYLVVDGVLNTAYDTTTITLSRTRTVNSNRLSVPESNAVVSIEEEGGQSYSLTPGDSGTYTLLPGIVDVTKNLRVHIETQNNVEYVSEFVPAVANPAIDNVTVSKVPLNNVDGVQIAVSTHDATNTARYFLWRYDETWLFHSKFASSLIQLPDGSVVDRPFDQEVDQCYTTVPSAAVLIHATTGLSEDVIANFPLVHIPFTDYRFQTRYSMNVHQYALTEQAYVFWTALKNNTENLGTIFGSLPSQTPGNYKCVTNPEEPVFGFFSATQVQDRRIFIDPVTDKFPPALTVDPFYVGCEMNFLTPTQSARITTDLFLYPSYDGMVFLGYFTATPVCADCRLHHGVTAVPSFW